MKCRHCDEDLVCKVCGEKQSQRKKTETKKLTVHVDPSRNEELTVEAERLGISKSELVRRRLADGEK
jgi:predicted HicB family RNase H-like nuclease